MKMNITGRDVKIFFLGVITIILIYILSSWLIGLTVPVQGAIARYKSLTHPFLLMFIFSFINWDYLKKKYLPSEGN